MKAAGASVKLWNRIERGIDGSVGEDEPVVFVVDYYGTVV